VCSFNCLCDCLFVCLFVCLLVCLILSGCLICSFVFGWNESNGKSYFVRLVLSPLISMIG